MSKKTIAEKALLIRNETKQYGNTRGRVADVLDDINSSKAEISDLNDAVTNNLVPLQDALNKEIADRSTADQAEATARANADLALNVKADGNTTSISTHAADKSNPHAVTKSQVGLGHVDNTSDANKPLSTVQQTALNGKMDKPTATVTAPDTTNKWVALLNDAGNTVKMLAGDLGKNIANSFLDSVANAGINLKANWRIATNNFAFYIEGLADKSSDTTFSRMRVQNSSGQEAYTNGANMMISAITAMSDAQKDSYRTASRKTGENYSLGQPIVDIVLPALVDRTANYIQYISIIGANLFVNTTDIGQAQVEMKRVSDGQITMITSITSYSTSPDRLTFGFNFSSLTQNAEYQFRVFHNGVWSVPNTSSTLYVTDNMVSQPIPSSVWQIGNSVDGIVSSEPTLNPAPDIFRNAGGKVPLSKTFYAQQDQPIVTSADINTGVMLVFDIDLNGLDTYDKLKFGFSDNSTLNLNEIFTAGWHWNTGHLYYLPSNSPIYNVGQIINRLYVIIKQGVLKMFWQNPLVAGNVGLRIDSLPNSNPLYWKQVFLMTEANANITIRIFAKYKLS